MKNFRRQSGRSTILVITCWSVFDSPTERRVRWGAGPVRSSATTRSHLDLQLRDKRQDHPMWIVNTPISVHHSSSRQSGTTELGPGRDHASSPGTASTAAGPAHQFVGPSTPPVRERWTRTISRPTCRPELRDRTCTVTPENTRQHRPENAEGAPS